MKLLAPEWLLLLPAIALAAWRWPALRIARPARAFCLALVVLIFTEPVIRRMSEGMDLWVLVDRSASASSSLGPALPEWEALLERSRGTRDRLYYVDYAAAPLVRGQGETAGIDNSETRTALAIQYCLGQMDRNRLSRLLLLGDGYATEPLTSIVEPLMKRTIPLDYRLSATKAGNDFRVAGVNLPQRVQNGESFLIEASIVGTADAEVPYTVERDGQEIGKGSARIARGEGRLRFTDRLKGTGAHRYRVRLAAADDAHPENNEGEAWIEISGTPRVLAITAYDQDPVIDVLRQNGFEVEQVTDPKKLNPGVLSGVRLVVINNVPAFKVPTDFLNAMQFYVKEQGGSLLMAGGKFSFGSGGYFGSALDPLLPVSMELRKEHRKLRVAMCIVMDRSGSMSVPVARGGASVTKMELADEGAARSVELLGDTDYISVLAVDSEPHRMVPLTEIGPSRGNIISEIRRIRSEGGGIYVYNGLEGGWNELKKTEVGQRHLILFSDSADSEEPGEYKRLIDEMVSQGVTISVIGMGTEADSDADLLKDIAQRGRGRIVFNADPAELPALFAQETVAVARSAFLTDPVSLTSTAGWLSIAAKRLTWPGKVDGYNLSYLRPEATAVALSGDEYGAPLIAFWERGLGRTAAVSFPLAGDFSETARAWPQYAEFVTTLTRWLAGSEAPAGLGISTRLTGTELELDLFYDESLSEKIAEGSPKLVLSGPKAESSRVVAWERLAPGHFRARTTLRPGELIRGAAQIGKSVLPFGPLIAASNAEWQFRREAVSELRDLSVRTGGRERGDLSTAWESPPQRQFEDLRPWFLALLLGAVVLEAFLTRIGRV